MELWVDIGPLQPSNDDCGNVAGVRNPKSREYSPQKFSFGSTAESTPSLDDELESDEPEDQLLLCP
jgi:hypothetical protein